MSTRARFQLTQAGQTAAESLQPLPQGAVRRYDIRGRYPDEIAPGNVRALGRALALRAGGPGAAVVVGRDGRVSSPVLYEALIEGLVEGGAAVGALGLATSPQVYHAAHATGAVAAAVVTASHNPPDMNGVKIVLNGLPLWAEELAALNATIPGLPPAPGGGTRTARDLSETYVADLLAPLALDAARRLTVVWDAGNGAAGPVLVRLAARLPGRHEILNARVDGRFPAHPPDPTKPANLAALRARVLEAGADLGLALDGDGDRAVAVDNAGRIVSGDALMMLVLPRVLAARPGAPVALDIKASDAVETLARALGGRPERTPSGHAAVKTALARSGAAFAGEVTGHFYFADRHPGWDDGIHAGLRLIEVLAASDRPLAALVDALPCWPSTPEIRLPVAEADKAAALGALRTGAETAGLALCLLDGVRARGDGWWWLARASNTEPALTLRCEGGTEAAFAHACADLAGRLAALGLPVPSEIAGPACTVPGGT
ncbi:phosphomannomutase/phosphoglucomutase [Futiania mangrovi]|uniref:Phosphomannomutase/phosphoglucomutase n=1 Tax=Futiania mangrovi TaxID=2959716 RepID=A0A9J6P9C4_9PROT|nr:phosphomannomutase/phosphoglucomutase [Futiania mangrovii]MCP1334825.1 phosphomannomutase/phosphoglucomutase [Futiania mangrovii]